LAVALKIFNANYDAFLTSLINSVGNGDKNAVAVNSIK